MSWRHGVIGIPVFLFGIIRGFSSYGAILKVTTLSLPTLFRTVAGHEDLSLPVHFSPLNVTPKSFRWEKGKSSANFGIRTLLVLVRLSDCRSFCFIILSKSVCRRLQASFLVLSRLSVWWYGEGSEATNLCSHWRWTPFGGQGRGVSSTNCDCRQADPYRAPSVPMYWDEEKWVEQSGKDQGHKGWHLKRRYFSQLLPLREHNKSALPKLIHARVLNIYKLNWTNNSTHDEKVWEAETWSAFRTTPTFASPQKILFRAEHCTNSQYP